MTQSTFRYNPATSCLEEQPRMEKPNMNDYNFSYGHNQANKYHFDMSGYNEHIASLRSIPTDFKDWGPRDLIEERDFWIEDTEYTVGDKVYGSKIAIPLSPSQPKEERRRLFADLIYEHDLPEMTEEQYAEWYKKSHIVDGVRMGSPIVCKGESEEELWNEIGRFFCGGVSFTCYPEKLAELQSKYKLSKRI